MTATPVDELQLRAFDYTDASLRGERFHAAMAQLRGVGGPEQETGGRAWLARGPFGYMVLDREAGEFFLRSRAATFPGMKIAEIFGVSEGPLYEQMRRNILHVNGPDHARLRGLVNPALSPRAVERYRPAMRRFLEQLLADATGAPAAGADGAPAGAPAEDGVRCEFVSAFAKPYPSLVMATVMGAPLSDAPRLHHWSNWIQRQFDAASMASEREPIERAVEEFYEYAQALLQARRRQPADDLISTLIEATDPAHRPERLSDVECVNLVFNVLAGGVDTTQSQLAHAVRLLAERPEQWRMLVEDPRLAPVAVEEALRFEPITPFTARITTEEVVFRDVSFPPGTVVMVCAFTGNRDAPAREGEQPGEPLDGGEEFDLARAAVHDQAGAGARVLTFGAGVHYCVGANLARLELTEALAFLAARVRTLELDGEPSFDTITGIYGLDQLPLRLELA
ncbi:MAG TPA: cytochrome P450 [Solirubrobacteraceae bacterium]|nr:cytochrome P450 [Solirubrobacteraceae bacterium]